jgi:transcriptional regulator NrdR family protein
MRRLKCDVCGKGVLRVATTVRDKDGTKYRKRQCKECGAMFYSAEYSVTSSEYCAVWAAYCRGLRKQRKELIKDDSRTISKAHKKD